VPREGRGTPPRRGGGSPRISPYLAISRGAAAAARARRARVQGKHTAEDASSLVGEHDFVSRSLETRSGEIQGGEDRGRSSASKPHRRRCSRGLPPHRRSTPGVARGPRPACCISPRISPHPPVSRGVRAEREGEGGGEGRASTPSPLDHTFLPPSLLVSSYTLSFPTVSPLHVVCVLARQHRRRAASPRTARGSLSTATRPGQTLSTAQPALARLASSLA